MILGRTHNGYPLVISDEERRRHIYITGQTGTGKTTLLQNMMIDDLRHGRPFAVLDPHGDLAMRVANSAPREITDRMIYLDPLDEEYAVGLNPLDHRPLNERDQQRDYTVATFKHLWADTWGPRMEWILGRIIRLLLDNRTTFLDIPKFLTREQIMNTYLHNSTDEYVTLFWREEYASWDARYRKDAIGPIQNKVGQITGSEPLRGIFGQTSTIDLSTIMNDRLFLIANLSKLMGEASSHILGAFLASMFAQAAQRRASMPEDERTDFTLYVDEFQNFATDSFASILSEARKYRLNLVLANQFVSQLPEKLRAAVMGNVGTVVAFRIGADDVDPIAKQLDLPRPSILSDTPNHHAWVRTTPGGVPGEARLIQTISPRPETGSLAAVVARTRTRYARLRKDLSARNPEKRRGNRR